MTKRGAEGERRGGGVMDLPVALMIAETVAVLSVWVWWTDRSAGELDRPAEGERKEGV